MIKNVSSMSVVKLAVIVFFAAFFLLFSGRFAPLEIVRGEVGGASLTAPTGVRATDNDYFNKVGVYWDAMRGATNYRIYRGAANDPATALQVGATAANYFFDQSAAVGQTYFYFVKAENNSTVSNFSAGDQGTRAAGALQPGAFSPLDPPPTPDGNPVTATKAALGKTLFWDEQLSSTRTVSCGTCHRSGAGGSDPRTAVNLTATTNAGFDQVFGTADDVFASPGVPSNNLDGTYNFLSNIGFAAQVESRKAPSYLNAAYSPNGLFWDGRAFDTFRDPLTNAVVLASQAGLESQVLGPPVNSGEMAHNGRNWTQVAARVAESKPLALAANIPSGLKNWINKRTYQQLFEEAFGTAEITPVRIAEAIATHERTLFSDQTPLDRWAQQIEPLTAPEDIGRQLFVNLQCNTCHEGTLLTDHSFRNIGVRPTVEDTGRGAVTGNHNDDDGAFKTPTLRNVELHAPYMHNGRFATLEEVVEFYNRGGDFDAPNIDHGVIRPLNLSAAEKSDLVAFMKRPLTDPRVAGELPPFDRPTLYTETDRVPIISGAGRTGANGVPQPMAIEPPLVGNPSFTVAVSRGAANANAVLVIDANDPGIGAAIPASGSFTRQSVNLSNGGNGSLSLTIPNDQALIGRSFFGRWYVADASASNGFSVSPLIRFTVFGERTANGAAKFDYDGDGVSDVSVFRPASGVWYLQQSTAGFTGIGFGQNGDRLAPADYDGDGKTDVAVFRPSTGTWYLNRTTAGFVGIAFGQNGDLPAPADFDGDGKSEIAVFRPSNGTWYILNLATNQFTAAQFGANGDAPASADYDGDGKADLAVFRPSTGTWYLNRTTAGFVGIQFGASGDAPTAADYDGDGKTDVAVFRPSNGTWYLNRSSAGFVGIQFGANGDAPASADYDGDGKTDVAVFRPSTGTWYLNRTTAGFVGIGFGQNGDLSAPSAYIYR